jgi:hypothetical protein
MTNNLIPPTYYNNDMKKKANNPKNKSQRQNTQEIGAETITRTKSNRSRAEGRLRDDWILVLGRLLHSAFQFTNSYRKLLRWRHAVTLSCIVSSWPFLRGIRCDDTVSTLMSIGMLERQMLRKDPVRSLAEAGLGMAG